MSRQVLVIKECLNCEEEFAPTPSNLSKGNGRYCSRICASKGLWSNPKYRKHMSEAHKGQVPTNLSELIAFTKSEEGRRRNSERLKGKSPWNKGKKCDYLRGENHYAWKGGTGTERHQAMAKIEYVLWRTAVFMRDNYTCQKCNRGGGIYVEADHIKPWSLYPDLRYAIDNGRTLCRECHRKTDTWGRGVFNFRRESD